MRGGAFGDRQRLEHVHRSRSPSCGSSNGRSGLRCRRATCSRPRTRRSGRRSTRRRRAAARRRWGGRPARSRRDAAPISSCSTPTIPRSPRSRSTRCSTRRSSARAGEPVRDVMVGGRWVVRDGRHPHEDAVFARYRGVPGDAVRCMSAGVRPADHRRASRDDGGRRAVRRDPRRRHRHRRRADRVGGRGARPAARRVRAATARTCTARWATPGLVDCHTHLVYAGNRANEFEARLERRHVRGDRAGGRRHQGDRRGDARGERRRAGRGEPAAARGAGGARA